MFELRRVYNDCMRKQPFDKRGKFGSPYPEPLAKKIIGVRLPVSMDAAVRELAGDDLSEWIREAIAARLEQEKQARGTKGECA